MRAGFGLDQLSSNADSPAAPSNRAFEDVANSELTANPFHIYRLALVGESAVASDHKEPGNTGERGYDLLDHAVGEIFLLGIAAEVLERQNRNRWLFRQRQS